MTNLRGLLSLTIILRCLFFRLEIMCFFGFHVNGFFPFPFPVVVLFLPKYLTHRESGTFSLSQKKVLWFLSRGKNTPTSWYKLILHCSVNSAILSRKCVLVKIPFLCLQILRIWQLKIYPNWALKDTCILYQLNLSKNGFFFDNKHRALIMFRLLDIKMNILIYH